MQLFMSLHGIFELVYIIPFFHAVFVAVKHHLALTFKSYTWKECKNQVTRTDFIKQTRLTFICFIDLCKQVCNMIGLTEVVQNVIIFSMNAKLFKFVLESARLLKKTEYFVYLNALSPCLSFHVSFHSTSELKKIANRSSRVSMCRILQRTSISDGLNSVLLFFFFANP